MTIHVLVEGPSEKVLFDGWIKRLVPDAHFRVHQHQGKGSLAKDIRRKPDPRNRGLLDQLPAKLAAFSTTLDPLVDSIVVVVDADDDDCVETANEIRDVASTLAPRIPFLVRIAIEEVEAFYLGDLKGLKLAFPGANMERAAAYIPDSVCATWETFAEVIGDDSGSKVRWAEAIRDYLTIVPANSRSPSFRALCRGLRRIASPRPAKNTARRRFHHVSKKRKKE